jgi:prepilin-type N-terminal cleavage/methylation domain-containing protein
MAGRRGFSLLELVIVLAVLGIVAAIAAPRLSRAGAGGSDAALAHDLSTLRKAIDRYAAEHCGTYPSAISFREQLRRYTDESGAVSKQKEGRYIYGPYIAGVPEVAAGPGKGNSKVAAAPGSGVGWLYNEVTGEIRVNAANETDALGRRYADY